MNLDDVIYLSLLIFSIAFGYVYRPIRNAEKKKLVGTAAGIFIILVVSGFHILHNVIVVLANAFIVLFISPRICHHVSFAVTFLYLFFFRTTEYFGIPYPPAHTNLVQMILTLKLVGLAFEVNQSHCIKEATSKEEEEAAKYNKINPNFVDIVHYSFNYIGVLTGPYYKYRTFQDSFELPFNEFVDWKSATLQKLKYIPLWAVLFFVATYYWPLSYALTDEFYNDRSWMYRFWFIWPNFFIFRMRIYIGMVLSEIVCTLGGLGVYPVITEPKPGMGPSRNHDKLQEIALNPLVLETTEYNFEAIHNINPYGADFCLTVREGMKNWNMCVQFWLAVYIYKRVPFKQYRTGITMFVSAFWHGVYSGYYICICSVPIYLIVEDLYVKLFIKNNEGKSRKMWEWIIWFLKMEYFSYFAIAMHLLEARKVVHYYNSVYHFGAIQAVVLYVVGLYVLKNRKNKLRTADNYTQTSQSREKVQ